MAAATLILAAVAVPAARSSPSGGAAGDAQGAVSAAVRAEDARAALRRAVRIRAGEARGDLTLALMRLIRAYPGLSGSGERRARALLARPDQARDPQGNPWRVPEAGPSPSCSANFCVHWVERGRHTPRQRDANGRSDGDGIPDYVETVTAEAERSFAVENGVLGWREPRSDGRRGGRRGKTDIYLAQLRGELFGYAAPDRGQLRQGGDSFRRSLYSYLVLDDDYRRSEYPGTTPIKALRVTASHEYNHVLHFSYDVFQDLWFAEASAVWAEEQVHDSINDYLRYVRRWVRRTEIPLTGGKIKVYGTAVWNLWLERRYGKDLIRRAWARTQRVRPGGFSARVYDATIRAAGRSSFSEDFAAFARDLAEWRIGRAFAEGGSYRDVERVGALVPGARPRVLRLDHTTFAMLRVPAEGRRRIRVFARAPRGVAAALALVGRIGPERRGRTVARLAFRRHGGAMRVGLARPRRFQRLTAIVVNADIGQNGFSPRILNWRYTADREPFVVKLRRAGG
jgi:hypothetical protein